jgi:dolichyl-phosphate-mannose-protein mannosyltransferase
MAQKDKLGVSDAEAERSRKRSKSPSLKKKKNGASSSSSSSPPPSPQYAEKPLLSLTEDTDSGIKDNDIFLLPSSDYSIMVLLTIVAVAVRLFRIHQPSSVVFDEVQ